MNYSLLKYFNLIAIQMSEYKIKKCKFSLNIYLNFFRFTEEKSCKVASGNSGNCDSLSSIPQRRECLCQTLLGNILRFGVVY